MQQVSRDISNHQETRLLIIVPSSHFSWSPPPQKKGLYNLQRITMIKSNNYPSLKKSSALSQDKSFRDAVVASTMPRVNAGSGTSSTIDELVAFGKQVILTPYRFSCCSKVFPCDKYDSPLHIPQYLLPYLSVCLDVMTRKPTTRTNTQIV